MFLYIICSIICGLAKAYFGMEKIGHPLTLDTKGVAPFSLSWLPKTGQYKRSCQGEVRGLQLTVINFYYSQCIRFFFVSIWGNQCLIEASQLNKPDHLLGPSLFMSSWVREFQGWLPLQRYITAQAPKQQRESTVSNRAGSAKYHSEYY